VAPYAICMAYRVRFYMDMNAREAMHVIELRTSPQGHPSYRRVCQKMHRLIAEKAGHRAIAAARVRLSGRGSGRGKTSGEIHGLLPTLRSVRILPQGVPEMCTKRSRVPHSFPRAIAAAMSFADHSPVGLGRLDAKRASGHELGCGVRTSRPVRLVDPLLVRRAERSQQAPFAIAPTVTSIMMGRSALSRTPNRHWTTFASRSRA